MRDQHVHLRNNDSSGGNPAHPILLTTSTTWRRELERVITAEIKGELVSKIVPMLKHGAGVVTPRNHVRYVVTEYGIADLYGKTLRQRARAMIDVAHPQFREGLEKAAHELNYL